MVGMTYSKTYYILNSFTLDMSFATQLNHLINIFFLFTLTISQIIALAYDQPIKMQIMIPYFS